MSETLEEIGQLGHEGISLLRLRESKESLPRVRRWLERVERLRPSLDAEMSVRFGKLEAEMLNRFPRAEQMDSDEEKGAA
jgi:hypothetical protein